MTARPTVTGHRPVGDAPDPSDWVWSQRWRDLLFLHWRVAPDDIRPRLPDGLEPDTRDGTAWVSLVLFRFRVRRRGLPFLPGLASMTEVNVRTYVRCGERAGVYFLSIHADNAVAARLARWLTPLPYRSARMTYRRRGRGFAFGASASAGLEFVPGVARRTPAGESVDAWLLERYRAFDRTVRSGPVCATVAHPRWVVRDVEMIGPSDRTVTLWPGTPTRPPDLAHFADGVDARFGRFAPVGGIQPMTNDANLSTFTCSGG